jgi:N-formylglutamate amidohydrolase
VARPLAAALVRALHVAALFSLALARLAAAEPLVAPEYVLVQEGSLPIILAAPHGGRLALPGVSERQGKGIKPGPSGFVAGADTNTDTLAQALAAALEERTGRKPYLVMARVHRKYVDMNRPIEIAIEDWKLRPVYDLYHRSLARFCEEVRKAHGHGLLLDIHGQAAVRDSVLRGTIDGVTDYELVKRFGRRVHTGPESLAGLLVAHGIKTSPVDTSPEPSNFRGGHTVKTYGEYDGIGAVQLEFGSDFRREDRIHPTAAQVADAVADFARRYLSVPSR